MKSLYSTVIDHKYNLIKHYMKVPEVFLSYAICSKHYVELTDDVFFKEEGVRPYDSTLSLYGLTFILAAHDSTKDAPLCLFCSLASQS